MITRSAPLKRASVKRRWPKLRPNSNPDYKAWIARWPCIVCLSEMCEGWKISIEEASRTGFYNCSLKGTLCSATEVAHVGVRGYGQICSDSEAIPLGRWHHQDRLAPGGGPESAHQLGKKFWAHHQIDRDNIIAILRALYREETGREA